MSPIAIPSNGTDISTDVCTNICTNMTLTVAPGLTCLSSFGGKTGESNCGLILRLFGGTGGRSFSDSVLIGGNAGKGGNTGFRLIGGDFGGGNGFSRLTSVVGLSTLSTLELSVGPLTGL